MNDIAWEWERKDTSCQSDCLFSGNYKIVYYHFIGSTPVVKGTEGCRKGYHAYVKPTRQKSWGNHVQAERGYFLTESDAKEACIAHHEAFGDTPDGYGTIHTDKLFPTA